MRKSNTNFITAALATATIVGATALVLAEARRAAKEKTTAPAAIAIDLSGPEPISVTHHRRRIPVFSVYQY